MYNSIILSGPSVQNGVTGVMARFRSPLIAFRGRGVAEWAYGIWPSFRGGDVETDRAFV